MKLFEGYDEKGDLVYFEVHNTFLSRRSAIKIISKIRNVEEIKTNYNNDVFCSFILENRVFELLEPFGDNCRYHIGQQEIQHSNELEIIKNAFSIYKQWPLSIFSR